MEQTGRVRHVLLSPPIRVDVRIYAAAEAAGSTHDRSAAEQLTYWARLGRELERAVVSNAAIDDVLQGRRPYDSLGESGQSVVRVAWAESMDDAATGLDLGGEFIEAGQSWSELDDAGDVVHRNAGDTRSSSPP